MKKIIFILMLLLSFNELKAQSISFEDKDGFFTVYLWDSNEWMVARGKFLESSAYTMVRAINNLYERQLITEEDYIKNPSILSKHIINLTARAVREDTIIDSDFWFKLFKQAHSIYCAEVNIIYEKSNHEKNGEAITNCRILMTDDFKLSAAFIQLIRKK